MLYFFICFLFDGLVFLTFECWFISNIALDAIAGVGHRDLVSSLQLEYKREIHALQDDINSVKLEQNRQGDT